MNLDLIQIILILWLIERISIERDRYKLAIDTNNQFISQGYWSIWIYHKGKKDESYSRYGGRKLIEFTDFIKPKFK